MRTLWRALLAGVLAAAVLVPCAAAPDAAELFKRDVAEAARAIHWKGPQLADDTRLAVAASGLSWQPSAGGIALLRRARKGDTYSDAADRVAGFAAARRAGDERAAFAFGLSLVLDPPARGDRAWPDAYECLRDYGPGLDHVLSGVLLAHEGLPLLPSLRYAAADALVWRASPRTLPLFLTLAQSDDRYLRSRAVAGLGVAAYQRRGEGARSTCGTAVELREWSVSAVQQGMIAQVVRRAARDSSYRVRAAAALALGLMGDELDVPELQRLARDPAYLAAAEGKDSARILFPVRAQAAASLARFGKSVEDTTGTYSGKELKRAIRGGKDVTKDRAGIAKGLVSRVTFGQGEW